jgi:hypothetical protein
MPAILGRARSLPLSHTVTGRAPLLHGCDHLDLDHRFGLGETVNLDDQHRCLFLCDDGAVVSVDP